MSALSPSTDRNARQPGAEAIRRKWFASRWTGMQQIKLPRSGASVLEVADHYLRAYEDEYFRTRVIVKRDASRVMFVAVFASVTTGTLGTFSAVLSEPGSLPRGISVAIAVISGIATVFAAWGTHSQPRRHWIQKTAIVNSLSRARMQFEFGRARGDDPAVVAATAFRVLDDLFQEDLAGWMRMLDPNSEAGMDPTDKPGLETEEDASGKSQRS